MHKGKTNSVKEHQNNVEKEEGLHQRGRLLRFLLANFVRDRIQSVVCFLNCVSLRKSTVRLEYCVREGGRAKRLTEL